MNQKVFFFDIDGTLTDRKTHRIIPSAHRALGLLQAQGHFVALATGRAHYKTVGVMESLDIYNAVCCGGGCLVKDGEVLKNETLPKDKTIALLEHAEKEGIGYVLMLDDSDRVYMKDTKFLEQAGRRQELTTYILDKDLDFHDCDILKVYLAMTQEEETDHPWVHDLSSLRFAKPYLIYQYDEKKQGILEMLEILHANKEDVVVFGDDVNDMVMFDPDWLSIAMGNGPQELKDKANIIAPKNTEDGIYRVCEENGWIPSKEEIRTRFEELLFDDSIPFEEKILDENNWRFLSALDPSIAKTKGFDQKTPYHAYDVQIHIAKVVDGIHRDASITEEEYRELKMAAFLHDVGKPDVASYMIINGRRVMIMREHPEKSYEIATDLLPTLGYSEEEIQRILFLILAHDSFLFYKPKEQLPDPSKTHLIQNKENISKAIANFEEKYPQFHYTKRDWILLAKLAQADAAAHKEEVTFDGQHVVDTVYKMIERSQRLERIICGL